MILKKKGLIVLLTCSLTNKATYRGTSFLTISNLLQADQDVLAEPEQPCDHRVDPLLHQCHHPRPRFYSHLTGTYSYVSLCRSFSLSLSALDPMLQQLYHIRQFSLFLSLFISRFLSMSLENLETYIFYLILFLCCSLPIPLDL